MCPNAEFFLVRIFPHSYWIRIPHFDWIRRDTKYLSVFSPNAEKYGPEKTPYLGTFHAVDDRRGLAINNFQKQSPKVPLELKFH